MQIIEHKKNLFEIFLETKNQGPQKKHMINSYKYSEQKFSQREQSKP